MNIEPINKFWIEPTREELAAVNDKLKSLLLAAVIVAAFGWGLAAFVIFSRGPQ